MGLLVDDIEGRAGYSLWFRLGREDVRNGRPYADEPRDAWAEDGYRAGRRFEQLRGSYRDLPHADAIRASFGLGGAS